MVTKTCEISRRSLFQKIIQTAILTVRKGSLVCQGVAGTLTGDTEITYGVVGHIVHNLVEITLLGRAFARVKLPQPVEPCELENLLGEEECTDEVWLWTEEAEIVLVYVQHVRLRKQAILLACKIYNEGGRCQPTRS